VSDVADTCITIGCSGHTYRWLDPRCLDCRTSGTPITDSATQPALNSCTNSTAFDVFRAYVDQTARGATVPGQPTDRLPHSHVRVTGALWGRLPRPNPHSGDRGLTLTALLGMPVVVDNTVGPPGFEIVPAHDDDCATCARWRAEQTATQG
jgi:hypothetical protein